VSATSTIHPASGSPEELLAAARQWDLKFQYIFENGDAQGWDADGFEDDYGTARTSITPEGKYRWEIVSKQLTTWWVPAPPKIQPVADFYATVEVQKMPGSSLQSVPGILFRLLDNDNFYHFRVRQNGQIHSAYSFSSTPSERMYLPGMGTIQSNIIKEEGPNTLTVIVQGPAFYFYVNDEFVGQTVNDRLRRGQVMLGIVMPQEAGGERATVEFDNFELRTPPEQ